MTEEQARTLARLIEELLRDQQLIRVHSGYGQRPRVGHPCRFLKVYVDRRDGRWFVSIGDTWGMVIAKWGKWEINVEQRAIWCERPDEKGRLIYDGWIRIQHSKTDGSWTAFRAAEHEFLAQPSLTDLII